MKGIGWLRAALLLSWVVGCSRVLGFDDNPPASECIIDSDCGRGRACRDWACVSAETGAGGTVTSSGYGAGGASGGSGGTYWGGGNPSSSAKVGAGGGGLVNEEGNINGGSVGLPGGGGLNGRTNSSTGGNPGALAGSGGAVTAVGGRNAGGSAAVTQCLTVTPWPPPDPCRGHKIDVGLSATGGQPPFTWKASSLPAGLLLSADGHLSGTAEAPGTLTIRVEDKSNRCTADLSTSLGLRDTCWLAYVASNSGTGGTASSQLHLKDLILRDYPLSENSLVFPTTPTSASVTDFKFSPDGRVLAYRFSDGSLRLLTGPQWDEQRLVFEQGAVVQYAWSPDSSVLAVAYSTVTSTTGTKLGGVRVKPEPESTGSGGTGGTAIPAGGTSGVGTALAATQLVPIEVHLDSELQWFGEGRFVAYHTEVNTDAECSVAVTERLGDGFGAEDMQLFPSYKYPLTLIVSKNGFFVVDQESVSFLQVDSGIGITNWLHSDNEQSFQPNPAIVAPSGRFAAHIQASDEGSSLQVHTPMSVKFPSEVAPGCSVFLGWARDIDRFACLAEGGTSSELRFYDPPAGASSVLGVALPELLPSSSGSYFSRRRAFSPQGNWFALASDKSLYTVILNGGLASNIGSALLAPASPFGGESVDFSFSPDEAWLLEQRRDALWLHRLNQRDRRVVQVAYGQFGTTQCSESFLNGPDNWCGGVGTSKRIVWSPLSQFVGILDAHEEWRLMEIATSSGPSDPLVTSGPWPVSGAQKLKFQP